MKTAAILRVLDYNKHITSSKKFEISSEPATEKEAREFLKTREHAFMNFTLENWDVCRSEEVCFKLALDEGTKFDIIKLFNS